ncbi:hypothetical protein BJ944DRAFT_266336 [Cunninghamella echinulata]|nr:hypothetical protein BJ944DRAFT_266336 [Cunninghamella echinulata]
MSTAGQYFDSLSDDDSQDNNFSDYTTKTKSSRKRAATIKKKISRVKVPKTKRPGRKPIEKAMEEELKGDPKSKRKAQNRAAQRAFRERKEKFVEELQKRIQELEEEKNNRVTDLELENAALKKELQKLREKTNRPAITSDYTLNNNTQQQSTPLSLNDEDEEVIEEDEVPHDYKYNIDTIQSLNSPPLSTGTTTLSHHDDDDLSIASFSDHLLSDHSENDNLSEISIDNNSPVSEHEIPPFDTFETNPIIQDDNTMNENNNINSNNSNNNNNDLFTSSIFNNGYYDSLISVPNNNNNSDLTNQNQESFSSANNNTNDLFHGKTDFTFTNYRNPVSSDDWLYQNENAIPPLFGLDADRYGLNQTQLSTETPYDEQQPFYNTHNIYTTTNNNNNSNNSNYINLNNNNNNNNIHSHYHNHNHNRNNTSMFLNNINNTSINNNNNKNNHDCNNDQGYYHDPDLTPCKAKLLEAIHQAKKEGKTCGEVKQVVEKVCPDHNIDSLCDELRKKAVCFDNQSTFDDKDFEILKTCIKKH